MNKLKIGIYKNAFEYVEKRENTQSGIRESFHFSFIEKTVQI